MSADFRRLVICCDGTWQSSVSWQENIPSNVTKLCRVIAREGIDHTGAGKHIQQIVYYDSGVGTGDITGAEKQRQGTFGAGLAENVIEAYNFIVNNYEPGDEIFCFGFSRGAYTARAVAGLVADIGVLKQQYMQDFPAIYRAYRSPNWGNPQVGNKRNIYQMQDSEVWKALVARNTRLINSKGGVKKADVDDQAELTVRDSRKVKVVGVWDTVGSLGVPDGRWTDNSGWRKQYAFHNVKLSTHIEHAFHALALDEQRKAFSPTLWYIPQKRVDNTPDEQLPELKQCWFPGVHVNIGGGSKDSFKNRAGDFESMANVSFAWMLQCINRYLTIDTDLYQSYLDYYFNWTYENKHECTHYIASWSDTLWSYNPLRSEDEFAKPKQSDPHKHDIERGWGLGPFVDECSQSTLYNWAGRVARKPGECAIEQYDDNGNLTNPALKELGKTHEYMHPVAKYRMEKRTVTEPKTAPPKALLDFNRKSEKGRYWWIKKGDEKKKEEDQVRVPEWIIMGTPEDFNFEREYYERCLKAKEADEGGKTQDRWLEKVDDEVDFSLVKRHRNPFDYP